MLSEDHQQDKSSGDWPTSWSDPRLGATARFHNSDDHRQLPPTRRLNKTSKKQQQRQLPTKNANQRGNDQTVDRPSSVWIGQPGNAVAVMPTVSTSTSTGVNWNEHLPALWSDAQALEQQMHCMGWRTFSSVAELQASAQ